MKKIALRRSCLVAAFTTLAAAAFADPAPACKAFAGGTCCDPAIAAHLTVQAVQSACGESDATYLGEKAGKETCGYHFKSNGKDDAVVEVYAPAQKEVPDAPNDPFFAWKKVGKAFITDKAKSPKSAPMLNSATGIWLAGSGYIVSVRASTDVCTKAEASKLARSVR